MNAELLKKAHEKISSVPVLVNIISKRERELINGAKPLVNPTTLLTDDDGKVSIFATSLESMEAAKRAVGAVSAVAEPGKIYEGKVTGIKDFGAFVEILPGLDGLCHISEFSDKFLKSMDGVCKVGDIIKVKCLDVDERGRIKLSRKAAMAELDAEAAK